MHMTSALSSVEQKLQTTPNNRNALEAMIACMGEQSSSDSPHRGQKRPHEDGHEEEEDDDQAHDEVRLWEDGFKDRYYESKFDVAPDKLQFR